MIVDTDLIARLLDARTQIEITSHTGVLQSTLSRIKSGEVKMENLTVGTAHRLTKYALTVLLPDAGK